MLVGTNPEAWHWAPCPPAPWVGGLGQRWRTFSSSQDILPAGRPSALARDRVWGRPGRLTATGIWPQNESPRNPGGRNTDPSHCCPHHTGPLTWGPPASYELQVRVSRDREGRKSKEQREHSPGVTVALARPSPPGSLNPCPGMLGLRPWTHLVTTLGAKPMTTDPLKMPILLAAVGGGACAH